MKKLLLILLTAIVFCSPAVAETDYIALPLIEELWDTLGDLTDYVGGLPTTNDLAVFVETNHVGDVDVNGTFTATNAEFGNLTATTGTVTDLTVTDLTVSGDHGFVETNHAGNISIVGDSVFNGNVSILPGGALVDWPEGYWLQESINGVIRDDGSYAIVTDPVTAVVYRSASGVLSNSITLTAPAIGSSISRRADPGHTVATSQDGTDRLFAIIGAAATPASPHQVCELVGTTWTPVSSGTPISMAGISISYDAEVIAAYGHPIPGPAAALPVEYRANSAPGTWVVDPDLVAPACVLPDGSGIIGVEQSTGKLAVREIPAGTLTSLPNSFASSAAEPYTSIQASYDGSVAMAAVRSNGIYEVDTVRSGTWALSTELADYFPLPAGNPAAPAVNAISSNGLNRIVSVPNSLGLNNDNSTTLRRYPNGDWQPPIAYGVHPFVYQHPWWMSEDGSKMIVNRGNTQFFVFDDTSGSLNVPGNMVLGLFTNAYQALQNAGGSGYARQHVVTISNQLTMMSGSVVDGHLVPKASNTHDLGSADYPWRAGYFSSNSLHLGDQKLTLYDGNIAISDGVTTTEVATATTVASAIADNTNVVAASVQLSGGTGDQGTMTWNVDEETVDMVCNGATLQLGQELYYHVRNDSGGPLTHGDVVYASGTLGASGIILVDKYIADGTLPVMLVLGVSTEDMADGEDGKVCSFGKVRGIDTTVWGEGVVLYPSDSVVGDFVTNAPTGDAVSMPIAFSLNSKVDGTIMVRATPHDENEHPADLAVNSIVYTNTYWDDLTLSSLSLAKKTTDQPTLDELPVGTSGSGAWAYVFDDGESMIGSVQLPHKYKHGTALDPHIHFTADGPSVATWTLKGLYGNIGAPLTNEYSSTITATNVAAYDHSLVDFDWLATNVNLLGSAVFLFEIEKVSDPTDSGDDPILLDIDLHFEIDKPGSDEEIPSGI